MAVFIEHSLQEMPKKTKSTLYLEEMKSPYSG